MTRSDAPSPDEHSPNDRPREARGPIAYMARNGVAANLLMFFILAAGFVSLRGLVQEVFPEISLDQVVISVPYPGATPDEIEESILRKIEEQIEAVDDVKEIRSTAAEGRGSVTVELQLGADVARALDDIKAQVDRIQTFPAGAERPEVSELTNRQSVIRLVLFGDVGERTLKELAYRTEDGLAALPVVSYVETTGIRDYEISVEVPLHQLRALGLTLGDIAGAVRGGSLDLSAGSIDTRDEEVRIRTTGQNYTQHDFEDIIVLSRVDGTVVRLGDIAEVRDGFRDVDLIARFQGQPAVYVEVFRTSDEKVLDIVAAVEEHLEEEVIPSLPAGVGLEVWNNSGQIFESRLGLLVKNGLIGLALVLLSLTLFLDLRLAFWVAVGIAVSFVGTFAVMNWLAVSINMMTLFAFILAVGIVVDDAVVVGENIHAEREKGWRGVDASIRGTRRITGPVIFAVLTTVVAFCPLFFVPSVMGRLMTMLPVVVISVLMFSLVESLLVLPNHLSHMPDPGRGRRRSRDHLVARIQRGVDLGLKRFIAGPLDRALRVATAQPGLVITTGISLIVLSVAMVPAGIIRVNFMPTVEADLVTATLEMPEGTPAARTSDMAEFVEASGYRAIARLSPESSESLLEGVNVTVGQEARQMAPFGAGPSADPRPNLAAVEFKLVTADFRDVSAAGFQQAWREELGPLPEAKALTITAELLNFGFPVHVELAHPDPGRLTSVADSLMERLRAFEGVFDVRADQDQGLREIQLDLRPEARTMGLTLDALARQVRSAFFGNEAVRVQRGREEVRVYVRLPEEERNAIADVEAYLVRTPMGGEVPLGRVASVRLGSSPTTIRRTDGERVITVTADVDREVITGGEVTEQLAATVLPELAAGDPGLSYSFGGQQQEQVESFGALAGGFALALLAIYALLAVPFGSYTKPLIVMAAIPFGIIGAIAGHLLLGLPMSMMSMFGVIGLSGVVVNDSLVMIDFINDRLRRGMPGREAIIDGAKARFRPILLTSVTTFLGVAPLVFERSLQAQFLVPMAASLGFGILFATAVLMLIVPALTMVHHRLTEGRSVASPAA
ncbi:MAG: efflux RND transporter permease subunit [Gammaproteobacteria bacterium]|nr:efflux RND transporter permease subunit [Gammaproteobacteria bacterium]MYC50732.1 efflux RND transporter permease subunit [Gammaproteobacteria bacterium]